MQSHQGQQLQERAYNKQRGDFLVAAVESQSEEVQKILELKQQVEYFHDKQTSGTNYGELCFQMLN